VDDVHVLCSFWIRFVLPHDTEARFRFFPIQSQLGKGMTERMGISPDRPGDELRG